MNYYSFILHISGIRVIRLDQLVLYCSLNMQGYTQMMPDIYIIILRYVLFTFNALHLLFITFNYILSISNAVQSL